MTKDIWKNLLLGAALYYGYGDAAVDLQTGQAAPLLHNGDSSYVLAPPDSTPNYAVPMPESGAGASLYIDPQGAGSSE